MSKTSKTHTYLGAINGCCPAYGATLFLLLIVDLRVLLLIEEEGEEERHVRLPDITTHTGRAADTFL
jgi:hypothetical protein